MKKKYNLIIVLAVIVSLLFLSSVSAQNFFSVHQNHKELYGKNLPKLKQAGNAEDIIPLQNVSEEKLTRAVFGYLPDWEYANNSHNYFHYDLLTHIACFDFSVSKTGSISDPAGWPWTDLINTAHTNGVKVILTAVKFGSSASEVQDLHYLMTDQTAIENFYSNVITKIKQYKLDGINVDFEALADADAGSVVVQFMKGLTERVHAEIPGAEVSFATPVIDWSGAWDLTGLTDACDYVFIMAYAFSGAWSNYSGPNAPLTGGSRNLTTALNNEYKTAVATMPEKIILGLPYYGHQWKTSTASAYSPTLSSIGSKFFRDAEALSKTYGLKWDNQSQTPWIAWNNGDWNQIWYDNDSSLGLRYDLAVAKNLKGIGMWALGYDGQRQELWNLITRKFTGGLIPAPVKPEEFYVTRSTEQSLDLNFSISQYSNGYTLSRSTDGKNFKNGGISTNNNFNMSNLSSDSAYYFKVAAFNNTGVSSSTEVLASVPGYTANKILIINGFDRISGTTNTLDYIIKYVNPLMLNNYRFDSASNEAVFNNKISLTDYEIVIWILGDESTSDETFNVFEQGIVKTYLQNGGKLFVTGSEIGWDLYAKGGSDDKIFYNDFLQASYIDDAPGGQSGKYYSAEGMPNTIFDGLTSFNFDNGAHGTFDVDWPDAINARPDAKNILKFTGISSYAGISYEGTFNGGNKTGKLVYLSIPFETIYPDNIRMEILTRVLNFFKTAVSVKDDAVTADQFKILGNYPNPFNPETNIVFNSPEQTSIIFQIYNSLGQLVFNKDYEADSGINKIVWNGEDINGIQAASGTYFYSIKLNDYNSGVKYLYGKMMLLR
ncbi:MAG: T9SS type A sorting domain-containing protein [Bacteroidetes bacterium]|nr:T9SS type A sorting domain-containing protein [Bacteroidota bacterium]